ncbi:hypothetical protein [Candidatus Protochlamydia phocaeensis]|uniref:hypothetical protein n=1 Tax=Candidatus Protochlamydia phocaeensis TaxID=1414722 RepID=UPI000837ACD2|nr:hypothetical protein [Candidatus Protochlamydia phocaeensis]
MVFQTTYSVTQSYSTTQPYPSVQQAAPVPTQGTFGAPGVTVSQNTYPEYRPVTQGMHAQTLKLLDKAQDISSSILHSSSTRQTATASATQQTYHPVAVPVVHNHYDFSNHSRQYNILSSHTENHTTINNGSRGSNGEEGKDNTGVRVLAGVLGTVAILAGAFFLGKANAENEDLQEERADIETLERRWESNRAAYEAQNPVYCDLMDRVTTHMNSILQRKQANKTHNIGIVIFYIGAGAAALAGAFLNSWILMGVGAAIGVGATAFALYKLGYYFFSKRDEKDAKAIENDLVSLRQQPLQLV